jgi:hypothetical protein
MLDKELKFGWYTLSIYLKQVTFQQRAHSHKYPLLHESVSRADDLHLTWSTIGEGKQSFYTGLTATSSQSANT